MEEFITGLLRLLLMLARFIIGLWFVDALCFNVGRFTITVITFGKYPKKPIDDDSRLKINLLGLATIAFLLLTIGIVNTV
ncbi:hypothetical protein L4D76_23335 [Photobacterium sagamiensis]|uniref:hypothetical protein n=1 Tax=Photobacterium sagamiensis TaxID=2910241 RepID=UPI003D0B5AAE